MESLVHLCVGRNPRDDDFTLSFLLAGEGAYGLFPLGLVGTGMLGVPVLAGSCAYTIAEAARGRGASQNKKFHLARRFYGVIAVSVLVGLALNFAGLNAVKMLFWSA